MPYQRLFDIVLKIRSKDDAATPEDPTNDPIASELILALEKGRGGFQTDDIALITEALHAYSSNAQIAGAVMRALASLGCSEQMRPSPVNQSVIVKEGGLAAAIEAMRLHANDGQVQEHGCWMIATVSRKNAPNGTVLIQDDHKYGVWNRLRHAMHTFPHRPALQEKAMVAVACLAKTSDFNAEHLAAGGAIQMVCKAMENHSLASAVQLQACGAITGLASTQQTRALMPELGLAKRLCEVLHHNCDSISVVQQALGAIIALSQEEKFRDSFVAAEGVQRLLGTLSFHKWQPTVVEWCCQSLAQLCGSVQCQILLLELGAVVMLTEAIQYFNKTNSLEHMSVQAWSLAAIRCMVLNNPKVKLALQQAGFLGIVHESMLAGRHHPSLQEQACRFLLAFVSDPIEARSVAAKQLVLRAKFLDRLQQTLQMNQSLPEVLEWAMQVLVVLATRDRPAKLQMMQLSIPQLVITALTSHHKHKAVVQAALSVLVALSVEPCSHAACSQSDLFNGLVSVVGSHSRELQIVIDSVWVALNLAWTSESNQQAVLAAGMLPFVMEARTRWADTELLMEKTKLLLERISPESLEADIVLETK